MISKSASYVPDKLSQNQQVILDFTVFDSSDYDKCCLLIFQKRHFQNFRKKCFLLLRRDSSHSRIALLCFRLGCSLSLADFFRNSAEIGIPYQMRHPENKIFSKVMSRSSPRKISTISSNSVFSLIRIFSMDI